MAAAAAVDSNFGAAYRAVAAAVELDCGDAAVIGFVDAGFDDDAAAADADFAE